jgi:hypothetical protein
VTTQKKGLGMPKPLSVLSTYFNSDPLTRKPLKEFAAEIKELSAEEKQELAVLAAADLGVELDAA